MPRHSSEPKTYLSISFGKIREKVTKDTPGAVSRTNKLGDIVWERVDNSIEGRIVDISYKEHSEYGNSYEIVIDDDKEKFNLSLHEDSKFANQFLTKFPNVDISKFVTISPYEFTPSDSDKKRSGLNLYQEDKKLENFFASKVNDKWIYKEEFPEAPEGAPDKKKWKKYSIEVQEFLYDYFKTSIKPKFEQKSTESYNHFPTKNIVTKPEEYEDLPF